MLHIRSKKIRTVLLHLVAVIGLSSLCGVASAQLFSGEMNQPDHDNKPYYFGLTLGSTFSRFNADHHARFLQYDSVLVAEPTNSGGLTLGLLATARLGKRLEVRFNPQAMFMERGIRYELKYPEIGGETSITKTVESTKAVFPLQLKFHSDRIGNFRAYMMGGIKWEFDLASNAGKKRAEDLLKIKKTDYGPEFGLGFNIFFPSFILSPEIKISHGVTNIHSRDENLKYSNVFDKITSQMIVLSIHIEG